MSGAIMTDDRRTDGPTCLRRGLHEPGETIASRTCPHTDYHDGDCLQFGEDLSFASMRSPALYSCSVSFDA